MYYKDFLPYARENSGKAGEACEMCFKSYTSGRTVKKLRPAGKKDAYVTFSVEGKRRSVTVEVKTACGRIDNCCDSDYIAYWPEPEEDIELEHSMVVFSREEWRAFLEGYTGRGKILHVRKDGETHIQSFRGIMTGARPKASLPIANYIYEVCEKQPTVAEWLEALRKQYRLRGGTASLPSHYKGGYTMNEVINEVKALRHKLDKRMEAASEALIRIEAITDLFPEDSEAWEDMAEEAARLRDEIRAEEKIRRSLSLCEFCKLSTEPLCELCKQNNNIEGRPRASPRIRRTT